MNNFTTKTFPRLLNLLCFLAGAMVFIYLVLRAIYVPPYSDEVFTFFMYIQPGDFIPFKAQTDANNHFLNSFLGYISYLFFGSDMLALRLPNLLAFLVYAFYIWKIKEKFNSPIIGFCWFITLISAHYFITFFHLCRGYGLSMAFFAGALYYLILLNSYTRASLYTGLAFCSLAVWANLSLMLPVLVMGSAFIFVFYTKNNIKGYKNHLSAGWPILLTFILPEFLAVKYSLFLKKLGLLYHGEKGTFYESVVKGLPDELASPLSANVNWLWVLMAIYTVGMVTGIIKYRKAMGHFYLHIIFWAIVLGTIGLKLFLGVNYPKDRAAIYFFVLFMVVLFFALDAAKIKLYSLLAVLLPVAFVYHLILTLNLTHTAHWKSETVPPSFYRYMKDWQTKTGQLPTISCHGLLGRVLTYYDFNNGGTMNTPQESGFPSNVADFVVLNDWNGGQKMAGYDTTLYDTITGIVLLEREQPYPWEAMDSLEVKEINTAVGGIDFFKTPADVYANRPFCLDIEFTAQTKRKPMQWWLVFAVEDSAKNWASFNRVELYTVKPDLRNGGLIKRRQYIHNMPANGKIVNINFWNMEKKEVHITNLKLKLYRGKEAEK